MPKDLSMEIYIRSASCISPQQTFGAAELPIDVKSYSENKFVAIEPDYKTYLNIPSARRMSRLIKMGVCAALSCLKDADVKVPDAIIAGTGLGCMEDSEKFLASLIVNNEQILSPTSFIFSTHNTVAAQVALLLQCNNYNFTHTHRGLSFENSLLDSILFLHDHPDANILTGATDELTVTSYKILDRLGIIKKETDQNTFSRSQTAGTIPGEGSVFFTLSGVADQRNLAKLSAVTTFSNPSGKDEIDARVAEFILHHKITTGDYILTGINGDAQSDKIYHAVLEERFSANRKGTYKDLCGEYHTSTAFACWASTGMLKSQRVPTGLFHDGAAGSAVNRILIFNHYKEREFSLILLERC